MLKYRNRPIVVDGKWFSSKREAQRYLELTLLQKAGQISSLKTQVRFPLAVNGIKVCDYVADFTYRDQSGNDIVEDAKGFKTPAYKIKKKLLWAIHRIEIEEV